MAEAGTEVGERGPGLAGASPAAWSSASRGLSFGEAGKDEQRSEEDGGE